MKFDIKLLKVSLLLFFAIAFQDVFIDRYSPYRIFAHLTQLSSVLIGLIALVRFIKKKLNYSLWFNVFYISFLSLIFTYAVFSSNLYEWLPRVLYTVLPFFVFYNVANRGICLDRYLGKFAILFIVPTTISLYKGIFRRTAEYGSFIEQADNVGYWLLGIMILFLIVDITKKRLVLMCLVFLAVFISLKRGAMITSSLVFIFYVIQYQKYGTSKISVSKIFAAIVVVASSCYFVFRYSDIFLYRFVSDETGSGRSKFYELILDGWFCSHSFNKILGNGFFSTVDYLGRIHSAIYAHSDFLEILYDFGIFGLAIFILMIISLFFHSIRFKKYNKQYYLPFLCLVLIFLLKAVFSGTYMTKHDVFTYGAIGMLLGNYQYKDKIRRFVSKTGSPHWLCRGTQEV